MKHIIGIALVALLGCGGGEDGSSVSLISLDRSQVVPSPENTVFLLKETTFSVEGAVSFFGGDMGALHYDWYLNYPASCDVGTCESSFGGGIDKSTVSINPCTVYVKRFLDYGDKGQHLLELFVSESGMDISSETGQRSVTGTYAYISWWVEDGPVPCP